MPEFHSTEDEAALYVLGELTDAEPRKAVKVMGEELVVHRCDLDLVKP